MTFPYTADILKIKKLWWRKPTWEVTFFYNDEFYRVIQYKNENDAVNAAYDWIYGKEDK